MRRILVVSLLGVLLTVAFGYARPLISTPPGLDWTGPFALSALVAFFSIPLLRRIALRVGLVDDPDVRKHHVGAIPLVGGIAVFLGFAAVNFEYGYVWSDPRLMGLMMALGILLVVGVADDRLDLPAAPKLLAQAGAVAIVIVSGIRVTFMPAGWWGDGLEYLLTAVWLIGLTNAINFLDGVDGLAASLTIVMAAALGLVAVQTSQAYFLLPCAGLAGACLGFLPYNFRKRPASVFLGDAGATILGFSLASIAIMGEWGGPEKVSINIVVPLLILGVPIFDTTFITVTRIADGRIRTFREWLEYTGRDHIHHRLLDLGLDRWDTVFFICVVACILALSALILQNAEGVVPILSLLQGAIILTLVGRLMLFIEHRE